MRFITLSLAAALAATSGAALAAGSSPAPSYTLTTTTYSQNFDTLASSGTSQSLPVGFQLVEEGTGGAADGFYAAGSGSSNAGNAYSFGTSGDRALGSLGSGGVGPIYYGGIFTNGLGSAIQSFAFDYIGEQWRAGDSSDDRLDFQYSLNATEVDNGTWMNIDSLDFLPLILGTNTALNGNLAANQRALSGSVGGLSIANGQRFGFRWVDTNSSGNDHGLGVDNFRLSATLAPVAGAVPEPGTWALLILGFGAVGAALRRREKLAFA